jgi:hypothetical protein
MTKGRKGGRKARKKDGWEGKERQKEGRKRRKVGRKEAALGRCLTSFASSLQRRKDDKGRKRKEGRD